MTRKILQTRFQDPAQTPKGMLQFAVFDTDVGMPISNATVAVKEKGSDKVIEELVTDSVGQTATIDLPCPPVDYSLEPNSTERPYSEYTIQVRAKDFEPVEVSGIEILQSTTALQDVTLRPQKTTEQQMQEITIGEHTLWGTYPPKTPEDPVKPLNPESGFVVLDKPVIPEFVVVHAGLPNDNKAPNYYIRFADYIKNVASSEIYSTWPTSTITANVLAIISFTLNRVFTEWYRNQGKNFTLTNTTAYVKKW